MEELGEATIPRALKGLGCSVTNAPSRSEGFVYPFVGGPEFVIRFSCGLEVFQIEAAVDPFLLASSRGEFSTVLTLMRER